MKDNLISKIDIRNECDELWRRLIVAIYGPKCTFCSRTAVDCHHYFGKNLFPHLRYVPDNGIPCCRQHHNEMHDKSNKKIQQRIIDLRGKFWYNKLKAKTYPMEISFFNLNYLIKVRKSLKRQIKAQRSINLIRI